VSKALVKYSFSWYNLVDYLFSEPKLLETTKFHLATLFKKATKKIGVIAMVGGLLVGNGVTVSAEYSFGDFKISYEHKFEQKHEVKNCTGDKKVAKLSRKASY
jgi:hypothetical protein